MACEYAADESLIAAQGELPYGGSPSFMPLISLHRLPSYNRNRQKARGRRRLLLKLHANSPTAKSQMHLPCSGAPGLRRKHPAPASPANVVSSPISPSHKLLSARGNRKNAITNISLSVTYSTLGYLAGAIRLPSPV